jgi:tRNA threonylcarbamoyladenosine biosynthesis protein TsaB
MSCGASASLLAFDTSTEQLAVALCHGPHHLHHQEAGGARASARLVPAVMALLAQAGITLGQLDAVAFGAGPGAFTGLRTSAAVAQGLALGAAKTVLALDSLMIVAEDARTQLSSQVPSTSTLDIAVAMDARMDEVYAGLYRWTGAAWQGLAAPALYSLPALAAAGWDAQAWCGSALTAFGDRLTGIAATARRVAAEQDRAGAMLRVAQQQWAAGRTLDAAQALPLYLRDKVALTTAERLLDKAAKALKAPA